jgi:hypothetical protein
LSGQLVQQALQVTQHRQKEKKKNKGAKSGSKIEKLAKILGQLLGEKGGSNGDQGGDKKKKKKKGDKKKKRKLKDGVIVSSESNSADSSEKEETEEAPSETDMEAPLRRKSKEHPGSVLAMLVTHIKDQMDQSAVTETGSSRGLVTTGIKVMSYFNLFQFNLFVKPTHPGYNRELREMHHTCSRSRSPEARRSGKGGRHISSPIHSPASIDVGRLLEYGQASGIVPYGRCQRRRTGRNPGYQEARPGGVKGILPLGGWGVSSGKGRGGKGRNDWSSFEPNPDKGKGKGKAKKGKGKWNQGSSSQWEKGQRDWEKTQDKGGEKPKSA